MPELTITIGPKEFKVACQPGEEEYLHSAASLLDREAQALTGQVGRLTDAKMLLMAGLMLADRTAASEEKAAAVEAKLKEQEKRLGAAPAAETAPTEVAVLPEGLLDSLADLAARSESAAEALEEKTAL